MTTKSPEELAEIQAQGPAAVKAYLVAEEKAVFGNDVKHDRNGIPIEQGLGARGRETLNHFNAMRKAEAMGLEPEGAYAAAVAEIWKRDPERARKLGLLQPKKDDPAPAAAKRGYRKKVPSATVADTAAV